MTHTDSDSVCLEDGSSNSFFFKVWQVILRCCQNQTLVTAAHSSRLPEPRRPSFHVRERSVCSYLCPSLESPQFNGLWTLGETRESSGEVVNGFHLGAVHIQLYRASPSLQVAQSQEDPVTLAVSQLQVVENHQMDLPIILQVTEDGCNQAQINTEWDKGDRGVLCWTASRSQGWVIGKNKSKSQPSAFIMCAQHCPRHWLPPCCWGCFVVLERQTVSSKFENKQYNFR